VTDAEIAHARRADGVVGMPAIAAPETAEVTVIPADRRKGSCSLGEPNLLANLDDGRTAARGAPSATGLVRDARAPQRRADAESDGRPGDGSEDRQREVRDLRPQRQALRWAAKKTTTATSAPMTTAEMKNRHAPTRGTG
jgi:hypothetical protein